jgi:uroporphyrinogen III methyltransferase/synthase
MPVKRGLVYLIGAGPGDPGLITARSMDCLSSCDVVIYDHLASSRLLEHVPVGAEKIYAGKTGSSHFLEQDEINRLLVRKAKQGKTVARLKGGDPFVLGRGGEEAEVLRKYGIRFEVIPGITSAIAVPAYAGIPVTHRGLSSSFAVITGHEDPSKRNSSIRWDKLATGTDTLIILMGMQNLQKITARLIEHGRDADTPVAVIRDGTLPSQVTLTGTLEDIAQLVKETGLQPPAVVVVGEVVRLRPELRWFDILPLFGKRVLVTRAGAQAGSFEKLLGDKGALPVRFSTIEIRPTEEGEKLDKALKNLGSYQWVAFTSVNGVEVFFKRLMALGLDSRALQGLKIGAIGPMTGRALLRFGIIPDYMPGVFTGQGFTAGLKKQRLAGQRFLLPRADIADGEITAALQKMGADVYEVAAYRTVRPRGSKARLKELLFEDNLDVITFTSASTVNNLLAGLGRQDISRIGAKIACIGPKTAAAATARGLKVHVLAREQTIPGLATAMEDFFRKED